MLAIAFPVVMVSPGCGADAQRPVCEEPVLQRRDSGLIRFIYPPDVKVRTLDLFLYADSPTRPLVWHVRSAKSDEITVPLECDLTAVAIANAPGEFRLEALQAMDSMEKMEMQFASENAGFPAMSGQVFLSPNEAEREVSLSPLLCKISINSISNSSGERIESPAIHLSEVNSKAEFLRTEGFRPVQTVSYADELDSPELLSVRLSSDIGISTVHPEITLYCYPNDSEEATLGTPRTMLTLEGSIHGNPCTWSIPLPPIKRGGTVNVELDILNQWSLSWNCF